MSTNLAIPLSKVYNSLVVSLCVHARLEVNIRMFLFVSLPYILRQALSLNLDLTNSARLAGQGDPGDLPVCLSALGLQCILG